MAGNQFQQTVEQFTYFNILKGLVKMLSHEIGHIFFQTANIRFIIPAGQLEEHLGRPRFVLMNHAFDKIDKFLPGLPVDRVRHAEIQQANHVVRQDENIARMRVCMEKAVLKYLLQEKISPANGNELPVISGLIDTVNVGDFDAFHKLHCKHPLGTCISEDLWNVCAGIG